MAKSSFKKEKIASKRECLEKMSGIQLVNTLIIGLRRLIHLMSLCSSVLRCLLGTGLS